MPDAQDRLLALSTNPQMAPVEQVVDAVLFRRNRVIVRLADDLDALHVDLVSARRAFVGSDRAGDDDRGFLREVIGGFEQLVACGGLRHHRLDEAGAVADDQKMNFPARSPVVEPAFERDFLAFVLPDVLDVDVRHIHQVARRRSIRSRAFCAFFNVSFVDACAATSSSSVPS